jgi:predicted PurR-regulated permease PerM
VALSIFRKRPPAGAQGAPAAGGGSPEAPASRPADATGTGAAFTVPGWLAEFGRSSWLFLGLAVALIALLALMAKLSTLLIPVLFATLLAATFMPLADKLERRGFRRWIAALLVMLLIVLIAVAVAAIVVFGVFHQFPTVQKNLQEAADSASKWLDSHDVHFSADEFKAAFKQADTELVKGIAGVLIQGIAGVAGLIFGIFIGLNILVWFLMQGAGLGLWASRHMSPVPQPVAYQILANAARFLRGYIWGSTIIGLFNGAVMFLGALVLGVPLAATIGVVAWFTNYIPTFGAIIGGAFAVLIAFGSGGWSKALPMLVIVIIANGSLQTVVSQFALGAALKLHPLAVLVATTAGAILFGAIGGIVAAPFLKIAIDSYARLKAIGLFGAPAPHVAAGRVGAATPQGAVRSAGAGPPGAVAAAAIDHTELGGVWPDD